MNSRRDFLNLALKGSALTTAAAFISERASLGRSAGKSKDGTMDDCQTIGRP